MQLIEIDGDDYERGFQSGTRMRRCYMQDEATALCKLRDNQIYSSFKQVMVQIRTSFTKYYQELEGKAAGARLDFEVCAIMHCQQFMGKKSGCTTIVHKKNDGTFLLAHNEDDAYTDENCYLCSVSTEEGWFCGLDYYCNLWSGAFNWNSSGLFTTINFCSNKTVHLSGIPRTISWRHIVCANSISDLVERCHIQNRVGGFHVHGVDFRKQQAISIEVSPKVISVKRMPYLSVHTNHYLHAPCLYEGAEDQHSHFRYHKIHELLSKTQQPSLDTLYQILHYRGKSFKDSILVLPQDQQGKATSFTVTLDSAIPTLHVLDHIHQQEGSFVL